MLNGHDGHVSKACKRFIMRAVAAGLVVTSTTDGKHAVGSFHFRRYVSWGISLGKAVDVAGTQAQMARFQRREHRLHGRRYNELFGPVNDACRKDGKPIRLSEGSGLEQLHDTHVHGAPKW